MSAYEQSAGASDEWYTPPYVFDALGVEFDLDVAHPGLDVVDWIPAAQVYTSEALQRVWFGEIWMNAPFGRRNGLEPWLDKFFSHGRGIALTPDRTSAPWWQRYAAHATLVLFVSPKVKFIRPDGSRGEQPGTGTTLLGIGPVAENALVRADMLGLGVVMRP